MRTIASTVLVAAGCFSGLWPRVATACGGFFCSQTPVIQTSERIVFEVEGDVVTAYVQLQYRGDDKNFAWIVPVPEAPEVEVGVGQAMFDALEAQTQPIFVNAPAAGYSVAADDAGGFSCSSGTGGEPRLVTTLMLTPEVEVWKQEKVGPFDVVTLSAESAEDLNDWLMINGYRVIPGSEPIVQSYLDEGMKLLALKLQPEQTSEAIEPIKMTYHDSRGCAQIPIRLTAIAAAPGLEIVTWVFSDARAVPENFGQVEVDLSNVFSADEYMPALARAVDSQASGRGFVTEYARPTTELSARDDENLKGLLDRHPFVTRMRTELDPDEMTIDPLFVTDRDAPEVSNRFVLGGGPAFGFGGPLMLLALFGLRYLGRRD